METAAVTTAVHKSVDESGRPCPGQSVVVGLSGGADSVALLDALARLGHERSFRVVAAHLDHALRASSAEDRRFCEALCQRLGVAFAWERVDVGARARRCGEGIEGAARAERYAYLQRVQRREDATVIAVAHTRDDQAETVLLRLLRGAGSQGLGSMSPCRGDLMRPLLGVSRAQVLAHLGRHHLEWRRDPSNHDLSLSRNRVRHQLIPYLEAHFNPRLVETLARSASVLADEAETLAGEARALLRRAGRRDHDAMTLSRQKLREAPRAIARLTLRAALEDVGGLRGVGESHVEGLLRLCASPRASGHRLSLPGRREAVCCFGDLRIGPRARPYPPFELPLPVPGRVKLPEGQAVSAEPADGPAVSNEMLAVVAAPEGPLVVRTRRPGDRFRIRGKDVSLKRFLMARRVSVVQRPRMPLVASGQRVLWVPGQPVDVGDQGRRFVRLEIMESARS